ncbi:MAG: hypothetical protein JO228_13770 [Xanthobacteraceae bacterium]|nr:hypothetical protein [Xanthobacteraceae bacterium]
MTRAAEAPATNESITWREARCLAGVVPMLVKSQNDPEEFVRELEGLIGAAEALRTAAARGNGRTGRRAVDEPAERQSESAVERAVIELWRSNSALDYGNLQQSGAVVQLRRSVGPGPIDEGELASAVDEVERAAAILRAEELAPARVEALHQMPPMKQQNLPFWLPMAAATVGMLAAIVSFVR